MTSHFGWRMLRLSAAFPLMLRFRTGRDDCRLKRAGPRLARGGMADGKLRSPSLSGLRVRTTTSFLGNSCTSSPGAGFPKARPSSGIASNLGPARSALRLYVMNQSSLTSRCEPVNPHAHPNDPGLWGHWGHRGRSGRIPLLQGDRRQCSPAEWARRRERNWDRRRAGLGSNKPLRNRRLCFSGPSGPARPSDAGIGGGKATPRLTRHRRRPGSGR